MNERKTVIEITGKAYAGKDTSAEFLVTILEQLFPHRQIVRMSFANELKNQCAWATGLPRAWFDDPLYKESLRPLMQWWGDFKKDELLGGHQNYWNDIIYEHICELDDDAIVIISDARYDFEVSYFKERMKTICIRVEAINPTKTTTASHSSELGISDELIDYTVFNNHNDPYGLSHLDYQLSELPFIEEL